MARANCENIIELIEVFEDELTLNVVTKFMPSGDLYNYIC